MSAWKCPKCGHEYDGPERACPVCSKPEHSFAGPTGSASRKKQDRKDNIEMVLVQARKLDGDGQRGDGEAITGGIMEFYVKVSFWVGVASLILRAIMMSVLEWPRQREQSLGSYVGEALLCLAFTIWAGIVLWVR